VVSSKFRLPGDEEGQLMVVGPSRMEYDRILSMIETIASAIEKIYGKGGSHEK
jgi:heat-inducible transcriptional repressor